MYIYIIPGVNHNVHAHTVQCISVELLLLHLSVTDPLPSFPCCSYTMHVYSLCDMLVHNDLAIALFK